MPKTLPAGRKARRIAELLDYICSLDGKGADDVANNETACAELRRLGHVFKGEHYKA
jgi:hypothetical protein